MATDPPDTAPGPPPRRLSTELAIIIGCKLAIILTLWALFFTPGKRVEQTPDNIAAGLLHHDRTETSSAQPHPDSTPGTHSTTPIP